MESFAFLLQRTDTWVYGNIYMCCKNVLSYPTCSKIILLLYTLLKIFNLHVFFIIETPTNDSVSKDLPMDTIFQQNELKKSLLVFRRNTFINLEHTEEITVKYIFHKKLLYAADKYIVDCRPSIDTNTNTNIDTDKFKIFVQNLKNSSHRKSIRRYISDFKSQNGLIQQRIENPIDWIDTLLPLHLQVQKRNNGSKDRLYLLAMLRLCKQYPESWFCTIVFDCRNVPQSFGIFMIENDTIYLPLVGNNRMEKSEYNNKIYAYHILLIEGIKIALEKGLVMDLGMSHLSVKKIFEPQVVYHYLEYIGGSEIIYYAICIIFYLQQKLYVIPCPFQKQ